MKPTVVRAVVAAGFIPLALAACGGSGGRVAARPLGLTARLIARGEFRGYTPSPPRSFDSPQAYLAGDSTLTAAQRTEWSTRLTGAGFVKDVSEFLSSAAGPRTGVSGVMQLASAKSARAELEAELLEYESRGATGFPVKTIPGAAGYRFSGATGGGENILFADGPFLYVVGYGWYGSLVHNPKHSALIDAATTLYKRVHGRPVA